MLLTKSKDKLKVQTLSFNKIKTKCQFVCKCELTFNSP